MTNKNKDLEEQYLIWNKKLKDSGFEDVETSKGQLKDWTSSRFTKQYNGSNYTEKKAYYESVEEYYRQATWFLNEYVFTENVERFIWNLHSQGISMRNISVALKKKRKLKMSATTVNVIITKLVTIMKKMYGAGNEQE